MPTFDIIKEVKPKQTFRVASVVGKFDLQSEHIIERFQGNIDINEDWQIGLIVGKSGTGKTTIAKQLFKDAYITNFKYNAETILDDMPKECSLEQITNAFNSVGFSSPPSWLKPYEVLSNGQYWLLPDWVFNTDTMTFQNFEGQKKNRPEIKFEIFQTADKSIWKMFAKHHYLSHTHNNAANVFIAMINDEIAGFLSVLHFPHPKAKNIKKVHRLVILPDYQGAGFGIKFLNEVGKIYKTQKQRYTIVTSAPSLINALKKSKQWICKSIGRKKAHKGDAMQKSRITGMKTGSENRITASFELK